MNGLGIGAHDEALDVPMPAPWSWRSSSSSNAWSSSAWNLISADIRDSGVGITYLSFLSLNLFVKLVRFILVMCQHGLESTWSVHQEEEGYIDRARTLSERHVIPLCFATFFMVMGSPPKNFISFSSQMT